MSNATFYHPQSLCESTNVGQGTKIYAFAHILPGANIGSNCNICDGVFIENDVVVGDDVTLKCGVQLWDGIRLGSRVFVGPNATFTNDLTPRSKVYPKKLLETVVEDDASIGANATILPGIRIGRGAMVGAGAVVTRNVPAFSKVAGNPARIIGYVINNPNESVGTTERAPKSESEIDGRLMLDLGGCYLERLPYFTDMRGSLTPIELGKGLPFLPARIFLVYAVDNSRIRGEHAHHVCEQFLVCVSGNVSVMLDDGRKRVEVKLDKPSLGLYLAPRIWGAQYKFSSDAVLMVAASHTYDNGDYIRDYDEFTKEVKICNQS
jgi:acetyltransferase-like isoleucine patch superfamily enzyme